VELTSQIQIFSRVSQALDEANFVILRGFASNASISESLLQQFQGMMSKLSAISLFAGCGGSDVGLAAAGVEVIWANELNASACEFYQVVTGNSNIEQADVRQIDKFPKSDLLVGCYPCQGYSQGGVRDSDRQINFLYREFDRALRQVKPKAFIVENVDGMRFGSNSELLQNQLLRFRLAGYRVKWQVLNALDYGLAQNRKRLFIVGIRSRDKRTFEFPQPTHGDDGLHRYRTQRDVIWKWRSHVEGTFNDEPFHWYYLSRNRRKSWKEPAATVVANSRHVGLHPDSPELIKKCEDKWEFDGDEHSARRLSYLECAALQGFPFPKRFESQSLRLRYRAIGNAVPPPLFASVATELLEALKS
jgi:DNA (cytosine-5)-methyltransferase 1